jgi:hypothetical protein
MGIQMLPRQIRPFFWDVDPDAFEALAYPRYTIARILEFGDEGAVEWMRKTFPETQIREVVRTERRLSRLSANFWALVYRIPRNDVSALS